MFNPVLLSPFTLDLYIYCNLITILYTWMYVTIQLYTNHKSGWLIAVCKCMTIKHTLALVALQQRLRHVYPSLLNCFAIVDTTASFPILSPNRHEKQKLSQTSVIFFFGEKSHTVLRYSSHITNHYTGQHNIYIHIFQT